MMEKERRAFLKKAAGLAGTLFGHIILVGSGAITLKFVDKYWEGRGDKIYKIDLIRQLFGDIADDYRFVPGISHYRYPNEPHPDDREAMASLGRLGAEVATKFELVDEIRAPDNLRGNMVCLGSPVSNYASRLAMGYKYISEDKSKGLTVTPEKSPFLLPFEFALDADLLLSEGISIQRLSGKKGDKIPNWAIRNSGTGEYYVSTVHEGNLLTDYLLVSILPNIFDRNAYDNDQKLIIIAGSHGVGTKAIDLLFQDESVLDALKRERKGAEYWQGLIKITDTYFDRESGRMAPRAISPEVMVSTVHINEKEMKKWL